MDIHCETIMEEFLAKRDILLKMRDIVVAELKKLADENNIVVTGIEARIKTEKSLADKLELKGSKYRSLDDITDILGARIITFYGNEVDKIAALVEKTFEVDWANSVDKRKMLDPDRFGYMSLHYVCRIPKSVFFDEKLPEINAIRFEVQMRTALQHVWATIYHDTGYKSDIEIPQEYIRGLSRLAGMLEIADDEFQQLRGKIDDYRERVKTLIDTGRIEGVMLDGDTFGYYLKRDPFGKLTKRIAQINDAEIYNAGTLSYLKILKMLGFRTLDDVEKLIADYSDDAFRLAELQIRGTDLDIISSTIAIQNLLFVYVLSNGGGKGEVKKILDVLYGERKSNAASAERIFGSAEKLKIVR